MEKLGNHYLGADFSITSFILIITIFAFIFFFRKRIFFFLYKDESLDNFIKSLKEYLALTYPDFKFDYMFIHAIHEKNIDTKKYLIVDAIIKQYTNYPFKAKVTNTYKEKLWDSYTFYAKPDGSKLPDDWLKRKNAILERDLKKCQRCSKQINLKQSDIYLIKETQNGGTYYLENMILLCHDCMKIEAKKRDNTINIKSLDIHDNLYSFIR